MLPYPNGATIPRGHKDSARGPRGLRAILEELMTDVMFDLPSRDDIAEVKITESDRKSVV